MCVNVKTWCFYSFTINSLSTVKKLATLFLRHLSRKTRYKISQDFMVGSLSWRFYKFLQYYCTVLSLKKKKNLKKDASHLKVDWHNKRQKKNIEKRERKTKSEKKSKNSNKYFFTFTFYIEKFIFCQKIYLKKLSLYCYIYISFFAWQVIGTAEIKHKRRYRCELVL